MKISPTKELLEAAKSGDLEKVREWLGCCADIHADNDGALRWAPAGGHLEVVRYLLKQGADIHARDECALRWAGQQRTSLCGAISGGTRC